MESSTVARRSYTPDSTFRSPAAHAAPAFAAVVVGVLAANQGGWFATAWGWAGVAALAIVALWLIIGARVEVGRLDVVLVGALAAIAAWTAASIAWSGSPSASVLETERAVLYAAVIAAVVVLARGNAGRQLIGAVFIAIGAIGVYALLTRLFPEHLGSFDQFAVYRLAQPIGYWNGTGLFVGIGLILALGLAARGKHVACRVGAGATVPVLTVALYFTFSRGAWLALLVGALVAVAVDNRRPQLSLHVLALFPSTVLAVLLAGRAYGLTHAHVPLPRAESDGHRLFLWVVLLTVAAAVSTTLIVLGERRVHVPLSARRAYAVGLALVPIVALVGVFAHYGGPFSIASRAYASFTGAPVGGTNLNQRLFNLSSNGRTALWHVAWRDYERHPALGSGAGTYARHWFQDRDLNVAAQDAHGMYIETLAELGPVGLLLVVVTFVIPLVAWWRVRAHPLAAAALGAYVAFLFHTGIDWDHELPAVTLAGVLCGVALVVMARPEFPLVLSRRWRRATLAAALPLSALVLLGLVGNSALSASTSAREAHDYVRAAAQASKARHLMPWSPQPWDALGRAQLAAGDRHGALVSFRRAVAKDDGDWLLWLDLSVAATGSEKRHAIARAHELNPLDSRLKNLSLH